MEQQLGRFPAGCHLSLPFEAFINYLGGAEVGKSTDKVVVRTNWISQWLTVMLPHYNFISVLLYPLLLFLIIRASSVLLGCPHHVDLPLATSNQCHDVTHVSRIHGDKMALLFEFLKHDAVEVDPLLKGCSVIMFDLQILIRFASVGPDK